MHDTEENPYVAGKGIETSQPKIARSYGAMVWIVTLLCGISVVITISSLIQNLTIGLQVPGDFPIQLFASTALDGSCAFLLFCSARMWWRRRARLGILLLVVALFLFFFGPSLILNAIV